MIDVYAGPTPNGRIPVLAVEELELHYTLHKVNVFEGAHYTPEFLELNPSAQIPVIVDRDPALGRPLVVSQTSAMLLYLADKTGRLLPTDPHRRARALEALTLHSSDLAQSFYLAYHQQRLLQTDDEKVRGALQMRGWKFYTVLDGWLQQDPYLAGPDCSVADLAAYPWAALMSGKPFEDMKGLVRWRERMARRPAVQKGMAVPLGKAPPALR